MRRIAKKTFRAILLCGALLLASCGQQHKTESAVDIFLDENISAGSSVDDLHYEPIDTTRNIGIKTIESMRKMVQSNKGFGHYKSPLSYADYVPAYRLNVIRASYSINSKPFNATFYVDPEKEKVVAFKLNNH